MRLAAEDAAAFGLNPLDVLALPDAARLILRACTLALLRDGDGDG